MSMIYQLGGRYCIGTPARGNFDDGMREVEDAYYKAWQARQWRDRDLTPRIFGHMGESVEFPPAGVHAPPTSIVPKESL